MAKVRRPRRWMYSKARAQALGVGQTSVHDLTSQFDASYVDTTVVKVFGRIAVMPAIVTAGEFGIIAMGIMVVTQEALSVGAAAIPKPASEPESADWLWHDVCMPGDSATDSAADREVRIENDSARKLPQANKSLVLVIQNESGAQTYGFSYGIRCLFLL